jgi:hypothetical protein
MSTNLFIYVTSFDSLEKVPNSILNNFKLNSDYSFYFPEKKESKQSLCIQDNPVAIFVWDKIKPEKFCSNITKIVEKYLNIYIVYHENGNLNKDDIDKCECLRNKEKKIEIGRHEPGNSLYITAINFLNNSSDAEKIALIAFKGNPVLLSKLNLLHLCLLPEKVKGATIDESWNACEVFTNIQTAANSANSDPFNTGYIAALKTLRDKLLF